MRRLRGFLAFWCDFIVGDDWRVAAAVVLALVAVAVLHHSDINAWWLVPAVAMLMLVLSVVSARRT